MPRKYYTPPRKRSGQHGIALVASLMIMLILTILGVTVMNMTTLEERMAFNTQDRYIARYMAESVIQLLAVDSNLPSPNQAGFSATMYPNLLAVAPDLGIESGTGEIRYRESTEIANTPGNSTRAKLIGGGSTVNAANESPNSGVPIFQITVSVTTPAGTTAQNARAGFYFVGPAAMPE